MQNYCMDNLLLMGGKKVAYLLRDEFQATIAAGSLNGTPSSDGKSTRTVTDSLGNKISQSPGSLICTDGTGYGDPGVWYDTAIARTPGRVLSAKITPAEAGSSIFFGVDSNKTSHPGANAIWLSQTVFKSWDSGAGGYVLGAVAAGMTYQVDVVLRATGCFLFIQGGAFTYREMVWVGVLDTTAILYLTASFHDKAGIINYVRVPQTLWLPVPLASDGFATAFGITNGLGHPEGVAGGLGAGGAGVAWTQEAETWSVSGGKAVSTMVGAVGIATVDVGNPNVNLQVACTRVGGVTGAVLRYVDADNFIYAYHDGTNAVLAKMVAGTPTTIATAAVAIGTGTMRVNISGTSAWLYWVNTYIGTGTIADAGLQTSGKHGLYNTNASNSFDNFVAWARGS